MRKKLASLAVSGLLIVALVSASAPGAFAAASPSVAATEQAVESKLIASGLTPADASYYAQLQVLVNRLNATGKKIGDLRNAPNLTDQYVATHPQQFRQRILQLDPAALKKAILSDINLRTHGTADVQRLIEQDKERGIIKGQYTLVYPDGSSVSATAKTVRQSSNAIHTDTNDPGPWNASALYTTYASAGYGSWYNTFTWKYTSAINYSSVEDVLYYDNNGAGTVTATMDQGAASDAGIVTIASESLSNMPFTSAPGSGWIQGYTDILFQVSSSFSASFSGLSISVSAGAQWHQYAVNEVEYDGTSDYWSAQYA